MADQKITELSALASPATDDLLHIVDFGVLANKKITLADLLLVINGLPAITSGYHASEDEMLLLDNAVAKKTNLPNLFAGIEDFLSAIASGYAGADTLLVIDGGTAKYTTLLNFFAGIEDSLIELDETPADSDTLLVIDNGVAKYVTKTNLVGTGGQARLSLPVTAAHLPDDTPGSAAAQITTKITSSATDPQPRWVEALFDASTDEHIYYQFLMPDNYSSAPVVDVYYKCASATSGTAAFGAHLFAVTDGEATDVDAKTFDSANGGTATVPGTAGHMDVISITMTNADSVAANDFVILGVFRDISEDSVSGDIEVPLVVLRYTSS